MPCTYEWEDRCVVKRFTGFVTAAEFIGSAGTVGADARFDELRLIVNDLSRIDGHAIDAHAYLQVAASRIGAMFSNPHYRVAFIAKATDAPAFESALLEGRQGLPFDPIVVATEREARDWMADDSALDNPATRY